MINFSPLDEILKMNLYELRALDGRRATDDAIKKFVKLFNDFFSSNPLEKITDVELLQFQQKIQAITNCINEVEYQFAFNKYHKDQKLSESDANQMANDSKISYEKIPERMQYWAAGAKFGDTIRNPEEHKKAIGGLKKWFGRLEKLEKLQVNLHQHRGPG